MSAETKKPKVGVYVCHCGTNISHTVDVEQVRDWRASAHGQAVLAGNEDAPVCADEERGVEIVLEELDLPADRCLGHAEFGRRLGEAAVPRRCLEGGQRVHRRDAAAQGWHRRSPLWMTCP